jgi:uncharacterized membrane protein YgcG
VRLDAASVTELVDQVRKTLARRDLDALSPGGEIVVRLDAARWGDATLVLRLEQGHMDVQVRTPDEAVSRFLETRATEIRELVAQGGLDVRWLGAMAAERQAVADAADIARQRADAPTGAERSASGESSAQDRGSSGFGQGQGGGGGHSGQGGGSSMTQGGDADSVRRPRGTPTPTGDVETFQRLMSS